MFSLSSPVCISEDPACSAGSFSLFALLLICGKVVRVH